MRSDCFFVASLETSLFPSILYHSISVSSWRGEYVRFSVADGVFLPWGHGLNYYVRIQSINQAHGSNLAFFFFVCCLCFSFALIGAWSMFL